MESVEPEEHQGILAHKDEWRPGATCDTCRAAYAARQAALRGQVPRVNIKRLQMERESHTSSRDVEREIVRAAKKEGRELARPADYPHLDGRH